ncbi:MAG TPA: ATP-binding protein [Ramlibacter sp.]|uniref:sensor histidine kinase n=1 Tax=Ramlibacter sp. TaxID=1917967 RepID=UPI002D185054|nr:ATP-binding protein [Ramlibacter sp.]HVZ42810.1 ATP-binding protein [Ramlibacter sp.]
MSAACAPDTRATVLVVDDSPECLDLVGQALASEYRVRVATSGERALALIAKSLPDLVLLDVMMPGMDGYAVLDALRADERTRGLPVIFLSSLQDTDDELAGLALGAADFIGKPAPATIIRARVRTQIELKRTRDELARRNADLQDAVGELHAFNYTLSHDLQAPLHAIAGFAEALQRGEAASLSQQGRHRLERVVQGARTMNGMINDILACSRAERAQPRRVEVDLHAIASGVVDELGAAYASTVIEIEPLPCVQGDPTLIRQVFSNLVGNALKFSAGAAEPRVRIEGLRVEDEVEIRVRDNGAGFDSAYAGKLFGLFQRLHKQEEFPGTGVGLAIVKRIVARHGGRVAAESIPGGWTTFTFRLPSRTEEPAAA